MEPLFDNSIHPYCLRIIIFNQLSQPEHDRLELGFMMGINYLYILASSDRVHLKVTRHDRICSYLCTEGLKGPQNPIQSRNSIVRWESNCLMLFQLLRTQSYQNPLPSPPKKKGKNERKSLLCNFHTCRFKTKYPNT